MIVFRLRGRTRAFRRRCLRQSLGVSRSAARPKMLVGLAGRRLVTVALLGVLGCLPGLADADPPDPTWIAGFWDNADFDDVVILITSTSVAAETNSLCALEPHLTVVWTVPLGDRPLSPRPAIGLHPPRGPPSPEPLRQRRRWS